MQKHKKSILALFLIASLCVSVLGAGTAYTRSTALDEEGTNQVSYSSQNLEENDTVYMLMTDRFFDGNSSNNGTFNEEYRPGDLHYYQGGDWAGLTQKLQYIKDMGFTAIWISAPQENETYSRSGMGTPSFLALICETRPSARLPPTEQPATATFSTPYSAISR